VVEDLGVCKENVWDVDKCRFRIGIGIGGEQNVITLEIYRELSKSMLRPTGTLSQWRRQVVLNEEQFHYL